TRLRSTSTAASACWSAIIVGVSADSLPRRPCPGAGPVIAADQDALDNPPPRPPGQCVPSRAPVISHAVGGVAVTATDPLVSTTVSRRRALVALAALSMAAFTFVTAEILPSGLLTVIAGDLHRTPGQVGLLVSVYAAVVLLTSLPLARLTRRI